MKKLISFIFIIICFQSQSQELSLQLVASNLSQPTEIVNAGDDRLFIVEKTGKIKIFQNGNVMGNPFLDLSNYVNTISERGLLGLAFSPNFANDHYYYVNYSNLSGNTVIARFTANGNVTDLSTQQILLTINQPYSNHNGGKIAFGPDGYLYIGMGDGGSGGDPNNYAQNTNSLLGKMLRIDVSTTPYSIPSDNPYVSNSAVLDEIYSIGLRNPWKFSFDRITGDIWIADVGQNQIEEINHLAAASGLNLGWRCYEGNDVYNNSGCAAQSNYTFPIAVYNHGSGRCSITGGYVYRGSAYSNFQNKYFFADYCSGSIGTIDINTHVLSWVLDTTYSITTFGEDMIGELYLGDIASGKIYKLEGTLDTEDIVQEDLSLKSNSYIKDIWKVESNVPISNFNWFNTEGQLVYSKKLQAPSTHFEWNVSFLERGTYIVTLEFESRNKTITKMIIKE